MAITYQNLLHDVGLRINALQGSRAPELQTTYHETILGSTNFMSADFPYDSVVDSILLAEGDFAWTIANTDNHPFRSYLTALTNALSNESTLPSTTNTGRPIIGVWGSVYDSVDGQPCTEQTLDVVRRLTDEPWRLYQLYFYTVDGAKLYHTRPNVTVEVCTYDLTVQTTAFNVNGNSVLPDVLRSAVAARAIGYLTRDNAYTEQAAIYRRYADDAVVQIKAGLSNITEKAA